MESLPTLVDRLLQRVGPNSDALTGSAAGGVTFSGGWLRQADRDPFGDRPAQVFTSGKDHQVHDQVTYAEQITYSAPPGLALDLGSEFSDTQWWSLSTEGGPHDLTELGTGGSWEQQLPGVVRPNAAHERDQGASRRRNAAVPGNRDHTERVVVERREGTGAAPPDPVALQRGLNALAQNNPDGYRRGFDPVAFVHRRIYAGGGDDVRHHSYRITSPNVAYVGAVGPYVPTPSGTPYPTNARFVYGWQRVQTRAEPPSMNDAVEQNPTSGYGDVWASQF